MKDIAILAIHINNITPCYGMSKPCKVMGSPLKIGAINFFLDRMPEFVYKRNGNLFYAEDSGFISIYKRKPGTKDAFGGHKFSIKIDNGTEYNSTGDLWDPFDWEPFEKLLGFQICGTAISTEEEYCKCHAFTHCIIKSEIVQNLFNEIL